MDNLSKREIVTLGTCIALELVKGKTKSEINAIKTLIGQIFCTLNNINSQK